MIGIRSRTTWALLIVIGVLSGTYSAVRFRSTSFICILLKLKKKHEMKSISDLPNWCQRSLEVFFILFIILLMGIIGYAILRPIIRFIGSGLFEDYKYRIGIIVIIGCCTLSVIMILIFWLLNRVKYSRICFARFIHRTNVDIPVLILIIIAGGFSFLLLLTLIINSDPLTILGFIITLSILGCCLLLYKLITILHTKFYIPYVIIDNKYYTPNTVITYYTAMQEGEIRRNGNSQILNINPCKSCRRNSLCTTRNFAVRECDLYLEIDQEKILH
jgi:hypothetical protein